MEDKNIDISKIEIRSEEVQDILGAAPSWLLRSGISVILAVLLFLLVASYFFKYPDVISSQITLTTENPPAQLKALSTGKIMRLFYKEKDFVPRDSVIAIIENTANYEDILKFKHFIDSSATYHPQLLKRALNLNLGEIQQAYSAFISLYKNYQTFIDLDYYAEKMAAVKQQIFDYKIYYNRLWKQRQLQAEELAIARKQFDRDSILYRSGAYSKHDFEKAEKMYLQQKLSFENARSSLASTQMQINILHQQILDLKLQKTQEHHRQTVALQESFENLKYQLKKWEQSYLIKSPISGKVTFTQIWSRHQNVQIGEIVATVIPLHRTHLIGKLVIPAVGVGKVKPKQTVNIKLDNFPHMEFGLMKGKVKNIALVPTVTNKGVFYSAEIELPDSLVSNYGKTLKFSQEMTGVADIITDDIRLIERFLQPLRSLWKQNVE